MNINDNTSKVVEAFIQSKKSYLSDKIRRIDSKSEITSITSNPNQGRRKNIYNIQLQNEAKVVLKICARGGIEKEIEGMKVAQKLGLPISKLYYFETSSSNPLQNPYLIIEYIDEIPFQEIFIGHHKVNRWGREFRLNRPVLKEYVNESIDILLQLHQGTQKSEVKGIKLYEEYKLLIKQRINESDQEECLLGIDKLFKYYEDNKKAFEKSLEYHLHGDLDPVNIIHTNEGLRLIDWECYHKGDCAEDIAYYIIRNLLIPEDYDEQIGNICEKYSKNDYTFATRLGFYLSLSKLWHVATNNIPKEIFLEDKILL